MMLNWLAPDIQEAILRLPQPGGRFHVGEAIPRPIARLPVWEDQREHWRHLVHKGQ